jgi:CHAT domain-containing protein/tetratricopeptide (TPR) repeat protein
VETEDYASAALVYRCNSTVGENHPSYAYLDLEAMRRQGMGHCASAEALYRRAMEVRRAALGDGHPADATSLHRLAGFYKSMGDFGSAEPLCRRAMEIRREALGERHPAYANSLNNLAELYRMMGHYARAAPLYRLAMDIYCSAVGESHPGYVAALNGLAVISAATDRGSHALALMQKGAEIDDEIIDKILSMGSERKRAAFLASFRRRRETFLSLALDHLDKSREMVRAAFDLVLRRKALEAEGLAVHRDAVMQGRYPDLQSELRELHTLRAWIVAQIIQKALAGSGPEGPGAHRNLLIELTGLRDKLGQELAGRIPEMNLESTLRAADLRAVALALPEEVALVEFVHLDPYDFKAVAARGEAQWKAARYVAFVLLGGEPDEVQMVDLGMAGRIDRLIGDFRAAIIAEPETGDDRDMGKRRELAAVRTHDGAGSDLRATVFDRLIRAIGNRTRLLIAPDGELARLPFEVSPTADGRCLIDDYQITYLSCGRDVLRFGAACTGSPSAPIVLAAPDFDLELGGRPAPKRAATSQPTGRGSPFHWLPGTRAEGERVAAMLGVSPWLGDSALEGRLRRECCSPRILHISTHGFLLPDQQRDPVEEYQKGLLDHDPPLNSPMMENPMLRSGLALAGANTWLAGARTWWIRAGNLPEEAEDGLLTAEDVTGLDLLATELVVLSACETGLGQVRVGEGVFGLRRAFVLAGARTLVMSLWKVPDDQTRELMEDFYSRLLASEGRAEALRQAQLAMKARYPDPFYWGAFICQGDPSPLGKAESQTGRAAVSAL